MHKLSHQTSPANDHSSATALPQPGQRLGFGAAPQRGRASGQTARPTPRFRVRYISPQELIDAHPIRRRDPLTDKLEKRAVDAILSGSCWLSARDVGLRVNPQAANPHALASRWLKEGRVFAISRNGQREFPDYAFDLLGQPLPALREVLSLFGDAPALRLASWFESRTALLGGQRPRELLADDPQAVIAAARAHLLGPVHG